MDELGRPLRSLRVSVTDRCNLRCQYCMPEMDYVWLPRQHLLSFEETARLVGVFTEIGVDKVRLTGGEPLLRKDLASLVRQLRDNRRIRDLALTTNGILLSEQAEALKEAGLDRITVSLDTLRADRFRELTRRDQLARVLGGIDSAVAAGLRGLKIDTVVLRGTNEDEIPDLIEYGERIGAEVRFIEYMDVGGATAWSSTKVVSKEEILHSVQARFGGPIVPLQVESWAPAKRFRLPSGTTFGIIASTTEPFCRTCDRGRLTADGMFYLCLYAQTGLDLRERLRSGAPNRELRAVIETTWTARRDRGAEIRLEQAQRAPLVEREALRRDPHLEMHTRGG
ncbi:MAG TPA: GTP 3',8-cyclase MoaA [Vicinamibacteria bacterium]|nr:GTP 3',8-cyclase MoaA [Vicinamibacteria bacterium]